MRKISISLAGTLILLILFLVQCTPAEDPQQTATLQSEVATLQEQVQELEETVARLSYNTASGGGVNLKMMSDPETGEPTVPMHEIFSFDRNHAMCRVDTNREAFKMDTFEMGEVVIEAYQFYMSMVATSIEQYDVSTDADGTRRITCAAGWIALRK